MFAYLKYITEADNLTCMLFPGEPELFSTQDHIFPSIFLQILPKFFMLKTAVSDYHLFFYLFLHLTAQLIFSVEKLAAEKKYRLNGHSLIDVNDFHLFDLLNIYASLFTS